MDIPVGDATFILAIATICLALIAVVSSRDTKRLADSTNRLAEAANKEIEMLKSQNEILRQQFELSIRPVLNISVAATQSGNNANFDVIVRNVGRDDALDFFVTVKSAATSQWLKLPFSALEPDKELRIPVQFERNKMAVWKVSITGAKDILGNPMKDIIDYEVKWPPVSAYTSSL